MDRIPHVSVIMGIYNCASTLQEALDSLYAQTFQDFEIILCDDGSNDNTYNVALSNQIAHSNIVLLRNEKNLGLNATLNLCLSKAKGKYIARMDGDDLSLPTRFEKEIQFLDLHPEYAIVSSPMLYFDEQGVFRVGKGSGEPRVSDFPKGTPFCHAPCMVRKEAYDSVNGYSIDDKLLRVEDYHLWIKMYVKGYRGYVLPEPLYMMRDDRNAIARRTWQGDLNEFRVKNIAVSSLALPSYYRLYSIRPILTHFLPTWLYKYLHKNKKR